MNEVNMKFDLDPETGDMLYADDTPPERVNPASGAIELVNDLDDNTLSELATKVMEGFDKDATSTEGLSELRASYIELMGVGRESDQEDDEEAADTSDHPLLLTALLRFQAKALSTLLPSDDTAVRTKPVIDYATIKDPEKRQQIMQDTDEAASRVESYYTEYLFEKLPCYEDDTDKLLFDMGLMGAGVRKVRTDETMEDTPVLAEYVPLEDLVISYDGRRLSHRIMMSTQDLVRRMRLGYYRAVTLSPGLQAIDLSPVTDARDKVMGIELADDSDPHMVYEIYTSLFLHEDPHPKGLARPYLITIHAATNEVLSVQRNWDRNDKAEKPKDHFVFYIYHPGKNSVVSMGLGAIIGNVTRALRKAQRRSLEAAYLQNHPSGFKLSSLTIRDQSTKVKRGQFMDIDSPTDDVRKAIQPHPFQGPSPALQTLSETMERNGKELGGIASIDFAALMKSGVAVGPAMAAFEESTEFQTSVHRRLYKANRVELRMIHERMRAVRGNQEVVFGDGQQALRPGDLMKVDIIPYMKPGQVSRQKMVMDAQATYEIAKEMPDVLNKRKAAEDYLRAIGNPNIDELLLPDPEDDDEKPEATDPISEYAMVVNGVPVRAAPQQNHAAHMAVHAAQLRMLTTSQLPIEQGEAAMAALSAHIAEHVGFDLMVRVSAASGIPMEQFGGEMPPEMEMKVAPLIVEAMAQIEADMTPADGAAEESKVQIEQVRGQNSMQIEQLKAQNTQALERLKAEAAERAKQNQRAHERELADIKRAHEIEMQTLKDAAQMDREIEDNTTALRIAEKKGSGSANAGAKAGARNPV